MQNFFQNRRTFLISRLVGSVGFMGSFGARAAAIREAIFPVPFAGSPTVCNFARSLFWGEHAMPRSLSRAINRELERSGVKLDAPEVERARAEFLGFLAVRTIAARALHRAGLHDEASICEAQSDLWEASIAAAGARSTIGWHDHFSHSNLCPQHQKKCFDRAYGASAHACTASYYADHVDMEVVVQAGEYCARSLIDCCFCDDEIEAEDAPWIWDFAATAINTAMRIDDATIGTSLQT